MTISLYAASASALIQMLGSLQIVLRKTAEHANANGLDVSTILSDSLIADMLPMTRQVQTACDHAKGAMARISGQDNPKFEDNEKTIDELLARVAKTLDFVKSFKPSDIDGQEERPVTIKIPNSEMTLPAQTYLVNYAFPNFYFHTSMAYAIARKNGVPLGKANFMGRE
ncbi:MAG: DUF1993 domain-containing protein [Rhizobiaceae bacterium]